LAWWTFAGHNANATLAPVLASIARVQTTSDSLSIEFERALPLDTVQQAVEELRSRNPDTLLPTVSPDALEGLKFSDCLPSQLAVHILGTRARDWMAIEHVLDRPVRLVSSLIKGRDPENRIDPPLFPAYGNRPRCLVLLHGGDGSPPAGRWVKNGQARLVLLALPSHFGTIGEQWHSTSISERLQF
jgi:hypothetical protein